MSSGNLELVIGQQRLYAFTLFDGEAVHEAAAALLAAGDYVQRFDRIASSFLLSPSERLTHPDHRVLIDADARIVRSCYHRHLSLPLPAGYRLKLHREQEFFTSTMAEMDEWIMKISQNI